jgi:hypothetical protein
MVPAFPYIFKAKCTIIRVQCPVVALIVTRKSLNQSGPQSNPDVVTRTIKMGKEGVELQGKGKVYLEFS